MIAHRSEPPCTSRSPGGEERARGDDRGEETSFAANLSRTETSLRHWIQRNPTASLGIAVVIGATLGWLIKRQ